MIEKSNLLMDDRFEKSLTKSSDDTLSRNRKEIHANGSQYRRRRKKYDKNCRKPIDGGGPPSAEYAIDNEANELGIRQTQCRGRVHVAISKVFNSGRASQNTVNSTSALNRQRLLLSRHLKRRTSEGPAYHHAQASWASRGELRLFSLTILRIP